MSIKVDNVSFTYMKKTPFQVNALKNISFEIQDGDFVGIVGHTGSGKSTLIQIISGLLKEYEGNVVIDGIDYNDKKADRTRLRRLVGVVFQYPEYQLFEETVEKDIAFGPKKLGLDEKEAEERVKVAMDLVGLDYDMYRDVSPFQLSGGQKRKVAIAGVLAMEPQILILDEPIAGLDPQGRESFLELIKSLNECGMTILMVSHNMDNLVEYAKRIIVLKDGELFMDGTPAEVFADKEKVAEASLNLPEVASFCDRLREKGFDVPDSIIRYEQLKNYIISTVGGSYDD
ncbi:MAG: energy-coupling factor transporter ATPase [Clostridia bacterium]|nr:energy-coupling factor transporter ATPase [Clostridia bacterium]